MKKIFSAFVAIAMIASTFVTTAFAASNTFTVTASGTKKAGETVTVKVKLTGDAPFSGFTAGLTFDNTAFEAVSAKKSSRTDWDGSLTFGLPEVANETGSYDVTFVNAGNNSFIIDEGTEDEYEALYQFEYTLKVKDTAAAKAYNFGFVVNSFVDQAANNIQSSVAASSASVTVEASSIPATIAANDSIDGEKEVKEDGNTYFTKGLSATLTPGTETVKNVIATFFNKAGNEGKEKAEWSGSYSGATPITFAVNVLNVPDGEDVTATWEIVK